MVGRVGRLGGPHGSTNVVPGRCEFTRDIRSTTDPVRDAGAHDVLAGLQAVCERRGLAYRMDETMRAAAALSAVLALEPQVISWAEDFAKMENALFLGRGLHYPIALEGALKLKEISYIHDEA